MKNLHIEGIDMIIAGIQKTSLVDWPGKICSTVFLAACNFRCGFCHNPELVIPELIKEQTVPMSPTEFVKQIEERKKYIDGVCITGGEPTINKDLVKLCDEIKKMGLLVKLDTNGTNPKMLKNLIDFGLVDYVAMDIKGPKEKYEEVAKTNINIEAIEESIKLLMSRKVPYEFRTTVVKGLLDIGDIVKIGKWLEGADAYYIQQFNYSGKTIDPEFEKVKPHTPEELKEMKEAVKGKFGKVDVRGI